VYGRPAPPLLQRLLTDRLAESWARTVAGPSLEPLQLRGMAEVEP
jgi:hypothetical protein